MEKEKEKKSIEENINKVKVDAGDKNSEKEALDTLANLGTELGKETN